MASRFYVLDQAQRSVPKTTKGRYGAKEAENIKKIKQQQMETDPDLAREKFLASEDLIPLPLAVCV